MSYSEGDLCSQDSANTHNSVAEKMEEKILQPYKHILQVPGKMVRGKLAKAFNYWLQISDSKLKSISEIVMMLHNASLLIDDIEDDSVLRRGIPVAHSIYGVASTINAANHVYFLGLEKILALDHPEATKVFCEQLLELHRGQGMEIYWRDSFTCPSEEEYTTMTVKKTGGLFGLAIRLMQLFSDCDMSFSDLTDSLGLYFQIRDDYANLLMKEYSDSKSYCEDLSEGKFSFPIIHAIKANPKDQQILNIIRQRPKSVEVKRYCVSLLEKSGSFEYTRQRLNDLDAEARRQILQMGGNPFLEELLDCLNNYNDN